MKTIIAGFLMNFIAANATGMELKQRCEIYSGFNGRSEPLPFEISNTNHVATVDVLNNDSKVRAEFVYKEPDSGFFFINVSRRSTGNILYETGIHPATPWTRIVVPNILRVDCRPT